MFIKFTKEERKQLRGWLKCALLTVGCIAVMWIAEQFTLALEPTTDALWGVIGTATLVGYWAIILIGLYTDKKSAEKNSRK